MEFGEKSFFFFSKTEFLPYPNNRIFMGEKSDVEAMGQKMINTILAEFDFFPSKNHDSNVFMQFC